MRAQGCQRAKDQKAESHWHAQLYLYDDPTGRISGQPLDSKSVLDYKVLLSCSHASKCMGETVGDETSSAHHLPHEHI